MSLVSFKYHSSSTYFFEMDCVNMRNNMTTITCLEGGSHQNSQQEASCPTLDCRYFYIHTNSYTPTFIIPRAVVPPVADV
jgi:hypothetical protein